MLHIAICDDEKYAVTAHTEIAAECLRLCGAQGEMAPYTDSGSLLADIADDGFHFDLILLDIEMPGKSGMELAEEIRPHLPDVKIIFITSHIEYAVDAFELSVFRYVPKNDIEKRLRSAITDAIKLILLEDGRTYTIRTNNRLEKIPFRSILYIVRAGKNAEFILTGNDIRQSTRPTSGAYGKITENFIARESTTAGGTSKVRKSLQQVYEELDAEEFIFIDRGCIVNLIHVMQVQNSSVILKDGTSLPVSRSHLQAVKEQINRYWGTHI